MEFGYLDESGDLGGKGSKFLVLALMCTSRNKDICKIIRETKKHLLDRNKTARWYNRTGKIQFYSFPDRELLKTALEKLAKTGDLHAYCIAIDKNGESIMREQKRIILSKILEHIREHSDEKKLQRIVADFDFFNKEKANYFLIGNKTGWKHLSEKELESFRKEGKDLDGIVKIEHQNSRLSEELQALDLFCGSIFQYLENGNDEYFRIIKDKFYGGIGILKKE